MYTIIYYYYSSRLKQDTHMGARTSDRPKWLQTVFIISFFLSLVSSNKYVYVLLSFSRLSTQHQVNRICIQFALRGESNSREILTNLDTKKKRKKRRIVYIQYILLIMRRWENKRRDTIGSENPVWIFIYIYKIGWRAELHSRWCI